MKPFPLFHLKNLNLQTIEFGDFEVSCQLTLKLSERTLSDLRNLFTAKSLTIKYFEKLTKFKSVFLIKNKVNGNFVLINDLYGINQLFYTVLANNTIYVSTDAFLLQKELKPKNIDVFSVFDIVLYNYPLQNRTLHKEIKRLEGGDALRYIDGRVEVLSLVKPAEIFNNKKTGNKNDYNISEILTSLEDGILNQINPNLPVLLSMTGGFDSRVNFSLLKKLKIPFETYTFGNQNSSDALPAISISKRYGIKHHMIDLNEYFIENKLTYFNRTIESSFSNPFILDLAHYEYVKEYFPASNIITGYMGGEALTGGMPSVGQVTFTKMAKMLLVSNSLDSLRKAVNNSFDVQFINKELFDNNIKTYLEGHVDYLSDPEDKYNSNITNFLFKEKYPKFFGVVKSIFQGKHNQIESFTTPEYLKRILNLPSSYTKSTPFKRSAYNNYQAFVLYGKIIESTCPSLLETRLDRGYKVGDLLNNKGLIPIATHYFLNNIGRGNKLKIRPIDYKAWFDDYVYSVLLNSSEYCDLFDCKFIRKVIENLKGDPNYYPVSVFNKLFIILGVILAYNKADNIPSILDT